MNFLVEYEADVESAKIEKIISFRGGLLVDVDDIKNIEEAFIKRIAKEKNKYLSYKIISVMPFSEFKTIESLGKSRDT